MKEIIIFAAVVILLIFLRLESERMLHKIREDEEKRRSEIEDYEEFWNE